MKLSSTISLHRKPPQLEVLMFTKHLATMIKAGIPISEAVSSLSDETHSHILRSIIKQISQDIQNGQTLTTAIKRHPQSFDQFYISLIEISEKSGTLDENLEFITKQLAKNYNLKKKIQAAMLYPSLIFTAAIVMGGFIAFFILPQLVGFFQAFDIELPLSTKILLFVATMFRDYGILIFASLAVIILVGNVVIRTKLIKPLWHTLLLKIPIVGQFIKVSQLAQATRNFGVLIKSGVPISEGLEITANSLSNYRYQSIFQELGTSLKSGVTIAETIEKGKYSEIPLLVSKMISVGERTGKLDESLIYLGDFYEEEIDAFSKNLSTLLEPVLLISIGLLVGFVALAIITPIYELTGTIRR